MQIPYADLNARGVAACLGLEHEHRLGIAENTPTTWCRTSTESSSCSIRQRRHTLPTLKSVACCPTDVALAGQLAVAMLLQKTGFGNVQGFSRTAVTRNYVDSQLVPGGSTAH